MGVRIESREASDGAKLGVFAGAVVVLAIVAVAYWMGVKALVAQRMGVPALIGASVVYVAIVAATTIGFGKTLNRMSGRACSLAARRYGRRQTLGILAYMALLILAIWVHAQLRWTGAAAYAVAVLPTLPLLTVIVSMGLYLREETDEFERAVHTESALWASGGVLILATLLGFFEFLAGGPRFPNWLWFPAWCVMIGLASLFIRRRYR